MYGGCVMRSFFVAVSLLLAGCVLLPEDDGPGGAGGSGGGAGGPVECSEPDDCPGPNWRCEWRTCNHGVCGTEVARDGTHELVDSFDGDCARLVCDGKGHSRRAFEPNDPPYRGGSECKVFTCVDDYTWTITVRSGLDCVIRDEDGGLDVGTCTEDAECVRK